MRDGITKAISISVLTQTIVYIYFLYAVYVYVAFPRARIIFQQQAFLLSIHDRLNRGYNEADIIFRL